MAMLRRNTRFIDERGRPHVPNNSDLGRKEIPKFKINVQEMKKNAAVIQRGDDRDNRYWKGKYREMKKERDMIRKELEGERNESIMLRNELGEEREKSNKLRNELDEERKQGKAKLLRRKDEYKTLKKKHKLYFALYRKVGAKYIQLRLLCREKNIDMKEIYEKVKVGGGLTMSETDMEEEEEEEGPGQVTLPRTHGRPKNLKRLCLCGERFQSPSALEDHLVEKVRGKFVCDICHDGFYKGAAVIQHRERYHNGSKPYPCTGCKKFFHSRDAVKLHQKGNNGKKRCSGPRIKTGVGYPSIRNPRAEDYARRGPEPDLDQFE